MEKLHFMLFDKFSQGIKSSSFVYSFDKVLIEKVDSFNDDKSSSTSMYSSYTNYKLMGWDLSSLSNNLHPIFIKMLTRVHV